MKLTVEQLNKLNNLVENCNTQYEIESAISMFKSLKSTLILVGMSNKLRCDTIRKLNHKLKNCPSNFVFGGNYIW